MKDPNRVNLSKWLNTLGDEPLEKLSTAHGWIAFGFEQRVANQMDANFQPIPGTEIKDGCLVENAGLSRSLSRVYNKFDAMAARFGKRMKVDMVGNRKRGPHVDRLGDLIAKKARSILLGRELAKQVDTATSLPKASTISGEDLYERINRASVREA